MTKPTTAPDFQLVVLRDVEPPMTNKTDHADCNERNANEEPGPIDSPPGVHEFKAVIQDDGAHDRKYDWPQQAFAWWGRDAGGQVSLMFTRRLDRNTWPYSGLYLMSGFDAGGACGMNNGQQLNILPVTVWARDGIVTYH